MKKNYCYNAISKHNLILGVSVKVLTTEIGIASLLVFLVHKPFMVFPIIVFHIFLSILNYKDFWWKEILKSLLRLPNNE